MRVNAYCEDRGWLFEDLKVELAAAGAEVSDFPLPGCDVYICIRTREHRQTLAPAKTIIQVHDLTSKPVPGARHVSFVHDDAAKLWHRKGWRGSFDVTPIGARSVLDNPPLPERPTIGFFCREVWDANKVQAKRSDLFAAAVQLARLEAKFDVLMIGEKLEHIAHLGQYEARSATVEDLARIDALVTTSRSTMIPLNVYEALGSGVRVISTPRTFGSYGAHVWQADPTPEALAAQLLRAVREERGRAPAVAVPTRAKWAMAQVRQAKRLNAWHRRQLSYNNPKIRPVTPAKTSIVLWTHPNSPHQGTHLGALAQGLRRHGVATMLTHDYAATAGASVVACWGWHKGKHIQARGQMALIMERGYLGDRHRWTSLALNGLNGRATFPPPPADSHPSRFQQHHGHLYRPWRTGGQYALVIGQVPGDASLQGRDLYAAGGFYETMARRCVELYNLPAYFRPHPLTLKRGGAQEIRGASTLGGSLEEALAGAALVVTFNSNTGVESLLAGVPTVVSDVGAMSWEVALHELPASLDVPEPAGRRDWAEALAWKQWELEEIKSGRALETLLPLLAL